MPGFDKTGPMGKGQGTGGRRGVCDNTANETGVGGRGQGQCRRAGGDGRGLGQRGGRGRRQGIGNTTTDDSQNSDQK
jgi:hypothetical protein